MLFIVYVCLRYFFPLASVTNLAAISLERMHATFRPFKHRLIKKKIFGAAVAGVWFTAALSTAIVFSPFFLGLSDITPLFQRVVAASYFSLLLCCLFIMVVSYLSIATKFYCGMHPQHHGAIDPYHSMSKQKILPVEPLIQCEAGRAKTMQRQSLYSPRTPKWPLSDKGELEEKEN